MRADLLAPAEPRSGGRPAMRASRRDGPTCNVLSHWERRRPDRPGAHRAGGRRGRRRTWWASTDTRRDPRARSAAREFARAHARARRRRGRGRGDPRPSTAILIGLLASRSGCRRGTDGRCRRSEPIHAQGGVAVVAHPFHIRFVGPARGQRSIGPMAATCRSERDRGSSTTAGRLLPPLRRLAAGRNSRRRMRRSPPAATLTDVWYLGQARSLGFSGRDGACAAASGADGGPERCAHVRLVVERRQDGPRHLRIQLRAMLRFLRALRASACIRGDRAVKPLVDPGGHDERTSQPDGSAGSSVGRRARAAASSG
jgi:hypothetical protein